MNITIADLRLDQVVKFQETTSMLYESFRTPVNAAVWDINDAFREVQDSMSPDCISRIAMDEYGRLLGWVAGASAYNGNVWELHPLVVHPSYRGQGVGRALVLDFEQRVKERGGVTIYLGTDDEDNRTSLGGVELYPDVWQHMAQVKNLNRHPFEFYQKMGFSIVGVIPDANGLGKPDILMAKRVA